MKKALLCLGLMTLWAAQARADSSPVWNVSGSFQLGTVAGGGVEAGTFSFTITTVPGGPGFLPVITNSVMNASGILGPMTPFTNAFILAEGVIPGDTSAVGYTPTFGAEGAEIDLRFIFPTSDSQPQFTDGTLYSCGGAACVNEFSPLGITLAINYPVDFQVSVVPVATPEPQSLALLAVGLVTIGLRKRVNR